MILRGAITDAGEAFTSMAMGYKALFGAIAGLAMAASATMQGKAGAKAADALAETGKGFGNYIIVVGIVETVALFVMVFCMTAL